VVEASARPNGREATALNCSTTAFRWRASTSMAGGSPDELWGLVQENLKSTAGGSIKLELWTLAAQGMYQPCSSLAALVDSGKPAEEVKVEGEGGACVRGKRYRLKVRQQVVSRKCGCGHGCFYLLSGCVTHPDRPQPVCHKLPTM
jgi:hypothetical protein